MQALGVILFGGSSALMIAYLIVSFIRDERRAKH